MRNEIADFELTLEGINCFFLLCVCLDKILSCNLRFKLR